MSTSPIDDHLDGRRSPKRRRLDVVEVQATPLTSTASSLPTTLDTPTPRRPSWSTTTGALSPVQPDGQHLKGHEATDDAFLREPRPLPRQRLRSVELSVTPGLDSTSKAATPLAEPPEQHGFIQESHVASRPSQSPSSSTNRSTTPVTQDDYREQASSPVPSHSTAPDPEPDQQQHKDLSPVNYRPQLILRGHKRAIAAVKFSPDGKWIASCCKLFSHYHVQ